ncbi:GldG family protein [Paenibacillus larvae]|uniref:GldG family protein n=1 Tax=Paenibacillus larvae TaxID=1464 RepID=UPI0028538D25|nr:GldG family protein [Paenibacillus larvae]MDR5585224.1 GldG family protein [Paenibacillus larvae]MDR5599325.1 GldG family protein [Paenibacillus larvae]
MKMNKWIRGTNATVLSLAVIGIFVILTFFLNSLSGFQLDLTKNKNFTLSDQTVNMLKSLDKDIHITAFTLPEDQEYFTRQVSDLVQEYKKRSGKITFDQYDLRKEPSKAQQYNLRGSSLVIEAGDKNVTLGYTDMFNFNQQPYSFSGEEKITQAINSLISGEKHTAYFLSGHQEIPLTKMNDFKSSLEGDNYTVKELNLLKEGKVPDDAEILFIIGAQNDLSDKEAELVKSYMDGNGKLYLALGFNKDMVTAWKNLDGIMNQYSIQDQHAIAVENSSNRTVQDPFTIFPDYGAHDITNKLSEYNMLTMMSLGISLDAKESDTWKASPLLQTSNDAYGETDIESLMKPQLPKKDDKDVAGPLKLGYAVENKDGKPKAVIMGGSTYLVDQDFRQQGNKDFALNSVNWLQEKKDQVTIRPREGDNTQTAQLSGGQAKTIFWTTVVCFPLFFLALGGLIWWRRRKG